MSASASAYLTKLFGLAGQTAMITGGSSGIGRSMALALAQAGCSRIILVARRPQPLADTVATLSSLHSSEGGTTNKVSARAIAADVSDASSLHKTVIDNVLANEGCPDILVNAAGVNRRPHMDALTLQDWDATLAANLTAPFILGQRLGPLMAERGSGRIINVVSQQAFRAYGNSGAYGASKAGLVGLTRSQAEAWSSRGVLCNAVAPGVVRTPLTEELVFSDAEKVDKHAARTMIGRNGVPEDFEGVVVWLAGRGSEAVTGQTIFVDGGYSAT